MKHIDKMSHPPDEFVQWCNNHPEKNWDLFSQTEHGETKRILSDQLRQEQGAICCYCEQRIDPYSSHVEHLIPKGQFQQFEFDYNNLLASCNGNPANSKNDCCGNKKRSWYSQSMVSPLDPECENRFIFSRLGQILPRNPEDQNTQDTIEHLGLNNPKLQNMRKMVFLELEAYKNGFNQDEYGNFVNILLERDADDSFSQFWTTIKYIADNN